MSLAAQLNSTTVLTPREREQRKSAQQRAEDVIYTLNHAITCLSLTDFLIAPFFSSVFGWDICGHGHAHGKDSAGHGGGSSSGGSAASHVHGPGCGHWTGDKAGSSVLSSPTSPEGEKPVSSKYKNAKKISAEELRAQSDKLSPDALAEQLKKDLANPNKAKPDKRRGGFSSLMNSGDVGEHAPAMSEHGTSMLPPSKPEPRIPYSSVPFKPEPQGWWQKSKMWFTTTYQKFYPNFREWIIGEAAGDLGAVPVTLAVQHFTPGVMTGIQHVLEPVVGGLMHKRAVNAAEHWADKHGVERDAKEVVDRAEELYRYEIRHLPQMVMWTVASSVINYGVMRYRNPDLLFLNFAKGKVAGAAITAGLVFGARTASPEKAHAWDETMGRRLVVPVTKKIGRLFGIEERDVDDYHARQREAATPKSWASRVKDSAAPAPEAVRSA